MEQDGTPEPAEPRRDPDDPAAAAADEALVARIVSAAAAAAGEERDRETRAVLAEMEKLRAEKRGWFHKLAVLAVSVGLFLWLGGMAWGWRSVPIILVVVFIHESGHYLGMLVCGYRDVSMVFLPLLGAAVSGQQAGVPGHKRALVALLGPVPGLVLGLACAAVYWTTRSELWLRTAEAFLLINGFNLLPFQPLDGGQLLNDVLFCRNRYIEFATALGGGLLMGLLGFAWWPAFIFSFFAIAGAFARLKDAGMADRLRPEIPPEALGSGDLPPPEVAGRIIAEVRRDLPDARDPRILAMRADTVLERLRVNPPGWAATVALVMAHGAALLFALGTFAVLAFAVSGPSAKAGRAGEGASPGAPAPPTAPAPPRP